MGIMVRQFLLRSVRQTRLAVTTTTATASTRTVPLRAMHGLTGGSPKDRPSLRCYSSSTVLHAKTVPVTYVEADGTERTVNAEIGKNLLDVAHDNNVELEGACGGELACSTCHLIFEQDVFDTLEEKEDDEDDMLDLAMEVTETSRLGCQIHVREDFAGIKVRIPDDGF